MCREHAAALSFLEELIYGVIYVIGLYNDVWCIVNVGEKSVVRKLQNHCVIYDYSGRRGTKEMWETKTLVTETFLLLLMEIQTENSEVSVKTLFRN